MPILPDLARNAYAYLSDDGNIYQLGMSVGNGTTAQGATPITIGSEPSYPRGWVARHIFGVAADGTRTKVPILEPSNSLWTTGGTFSKDGKSFTVEGKTGEKRRNRGI